MWKMMPILNIGQLYMLTQGGVTPYMFAKFPPGHSQVYRAARLDLFPDIPGRFFVVNYQRAPFVKALPPREILLQRLAYAGSLYQDMIFFGSEAEVDTMISRGFVPDFRQGGMLIGRYRSCGLILEVHGMQQAHKPLWARYRWQAMPGTVGRDKMKVEALSPNVSKVTFSDAPCGSLWIDLAVDQDGDGRSSPADLVCKEGNSLNVMQVQNEKSGQVHTCYLVNGDARKQ